MPKDVTESFKQIPRIRLSTVATGIRYKGRDDLCLFEMVNGSQVAALFTKNAFCAAPVILARRHLAKSNTVRYLLINAGNANAGTGDKGIVDAETCCASLAKLADCDAEGVLPFSTGVIGELLPVVKMTEHFPALLKGLKADGWQQAAAAIMTTDTRPKISARQFELAGKHFQIAGIAKGSGMICPNMATMLAFLATDAPIASSALQVLLQRACAGSFNAITVDGDTSTNDACVLVATGQNTRITNPDDPKLTDFYEALEGVCADLAKAIVLDGEGATKFVTINVSQASTVAEARQVAYCIAHSPLVKTALFASDANWGRILAAIGRAGLDNLDIAKVELDIGKVAIVRHGQRDAHYTEEAGTAAMAQPQIEIYVRLGRGDSQATIYTTDLSYDYVRINGDYRS